MLIYSFYLSKMDTGLISLPSSNHDIDGFINQPHTSVLNTMIKSVLIVDLIRIKFRKSTNFFEIHQLQILPKKVTDPVGATHLNNVAGFANMVKLTMETVKLTEGFDGADLRNVCTEVGMCIIRAQRDYFIHEVFIRDVRKLNKAKAYYENVFETPGGSQIQIK
ncbi:hypothetical protein MKX01_011921 [Papaver californicum]|nr:hypothetical protein MKX01_011921 [Papaver californicum]